MNRPRHPRPAWQLAAVLAGLFAGSGFIYLFAIALDNPIKEGLPLYTPREQAWNAAWRSLKNDKPADALANLEKFLKDYPEETGMRLETAKLYEKEHQPAAAIAHYQRVRKDEPRSLEAVTGIARCYAELGQADLAILHWEEATRLAPENAKLHRELGMALYRAGQKARAFDALQQSLALDPDQRDLYGLISELARADAESDPPSSGSPRPGPDWGAAIDEFGLVTPSGMPKPVDPSRYMLESVRSPVRPGTMPVSRFNPSKRRF